MSFHVKNPLAQSRQVLLTYRLFCERNNISLAMLHKLRKQGKAPRIVLVGSRPMIRIEDETAWRAALPLAEEEP